MESEILPLFIAGVSIVCLLEILIGFSMLKHKKEACKHLIGHVVSSILAMVFLWRSLFAMFTDFESTIFGNASVNFGLFGVCWAFSVLFMFGIIYTLIDNSKTR